MTYLTQGWDCKGGELFISLKDLQDLLEKVRYEVDTNQNREPSYTLMRIKEILEQERGERGL